MAIEIGDVVRFKDAGARGALGRVCKDNGVTVCVHFKSSGCLRAGKRDLEPASGKAPECNGECKEGC